MLRLLLIITLFFGNCFFAEAKPKGKNIMKKPAAHKSMAVNSVKSKNNTYLSFGAGISFAQSLKTNLTFNDGGDLKDYSVRPRNNVALQGSIGHFFNDRIRAELSYTHLKHKVRNTTTLFYAGAPNISANIKNNITSDALLANIYHHLIIEKKLSYYYMAGLGISRNKIGRTNIFTYDAENVESGGVPTTIASKSKTVFAWNVGTGIQHRDNNVIYDITYKYMNLGKLPNKVFRNRLETHQIVASIGILF